MFKEAFCVIIVACVLIETAETTKLPELLLIDEARTQMSDAVDWTQQTQFDTLKKLAENQQKWLKDLEALVTRNDRCDKLVPSKQVAFSAYLNEDIDGEVNNKIIVFNQVILNEGGFYDPETGLFTCPWDGVYDFSFFVGQRGGKSATGAWAGLYVSEEKKVMSVVDAYHNTQDLQGGNRMIIRLTAGDIVKVSVNGGHVEGNQDTTTTFSGVFLFE